MSDLHLSAKKLKTLEGQNIPEVVDGVFNCGFNNLTSLTFGPKEVRDYFTCAMNDLTSLDFCPIKIKNNFNGTHNPIKNLKGINQQFKNGYIGSTLNLLETQIQSHVLGVVLIPKLREIYIDNLHVQIILNNHLDSGRDVLECQEELLQRGFKEFAQL